MEKQQLFQQNYSHPLSQQKKNQIKKIKVIKKDHKKKDKRKREHHHHKQQVQVQPQVQEPVEESNNHYNNYQSQTSKYQRLDQFWKVDIQNLYRKQFTQQDKTVLANVINQKRPTIRQAFKEKQNHVWQQKVSLELLYKYLTLIEEVTSSDNYTFLAIQNLNKKQHFVLLLDQNKNIQKAIEVSQEQLALLAYRQKTLSTIKTKMSYYNQTTQKTQRLRQVQLQIIFLVNYLNLTKNKLDQKLKFIQQRAKSQPKNLPPSKVQDNYISFLINKNISKALQDQQIDYLNHYKKLDINQHVSGLIDVKPITQRKDFQQYIRKRKLKKSGKKARWVLKTACGGCLSYHYQMYNPFSFCSQCHVRYHKYCYIPKNEGICESCYLAKSNQTKRSRINECQLCGIKGFLYLPTQQNHNAHIFCMLINGLWKFQNTQIVFQKKHVQNAIENVNCDICKQTNSLIYKCNCCSSHAHPLCAYLQGWGIKKQISQVTNNQLVKIQCCNGIQRQKNEKKRKYVLNYKRCVFSQCQ